MNYTTRDNNLPEEAEIIEQEENEKICPCCLKREKKHGTDYCEKCNAELSKTRLPLPAIISAVLVIAVSLFSFLMVFISTAPMLQVVKGDKASKNKNQYQAYVEYKGTQDVIDEIKTSVDEIFSNSGSAKQVINYLFPKIGARLKLKTLNAIAAYYSPMEAANAVDMVFSSNDSKFVDKNKKISKYKDIYNEYVNTQEKCSEILTKFDEEKADFDETIKGLEKQRGKKGVSDLFLNYLICLVARESLGTPEEVLHYFEAIDKEAIKREDDFSWLYYKDYAAKLLECGKYDEAQAKIEKIVNNDVSRYYTTYLLIKCELSKGNKDAASKAYADYENVNSLTDNAYALQVYLLRGLGEDEQAKKVLEKGLEENPSFPELLRQKTLMLLKEGKINEAYETVITAQENAYTIASQYGDTSVYSDELNATVYLATYLYNEKGNGKSEYDGYKKQILETYSGHVTWKKVIDILNGDITITEALTSKGADLI